MALTIYSIISFLLGYNLFRFFRYIKILFVSTENVFQAVKIEEYANLIKSDLPIRVQEQAIFDRLEIEVLQMLREQKLFKREEIYASQTLRQYKVSITLHQKVKPSLNQFFTFEKYVVVSFFKKLFLSLRSTKNS